MIWHIGKTMTNVRTISDAFIGSFGRDCGSVGGRGGEQERRAGTVCHGIND
jgi:hypothetical protein